MQYLMVIFSFISGYQKKKKKKQQQTKKTLYAYNKTYGTLYASCRTFFPKPNSFTSTLLKTFT
jgi:hypothetical protein